MRRRRHLSAPCEEPRDLAAALRNPAVLAAADAVLRGETARVVDFTLTVPIERQLRARFARIDRPSLDGAVAVLTLHDITQLKRAEQMRADFIANASHELRTPLATLIGFIETLRGPARDDAEARERFLAIMHEQAVAHDPAGRGSAVAVADRAERACDADKTGSRWARCSSASPRRWSCAPANAACASGWRLPPDLPDVLGDRDELAQVFQNLIDNAIKYGRAGTEITVGAATGAAAFSRAAMPARAAFVSVAVRDHGEGIAREHLPRLTERFYRVDTARSREMGGTGLGLAIVKHILNHHRGFLEIESTPGTGSVFTVFLRQHAAPDLLEPDCPSDCHAKLSTKPPQKASYQSIVNELRVTFGSASLI